MVGAVAMVDAPPQPEMEKRRKDKRAAHAAVVGSGGYAWVGKRDEYAELALCSFRLRCSAKSSAKAIVRKSRVGFVGVTFVGVTS